jgi:hypothetical protein
MPNIKLVPTEAYEAAHKVLPLYSKHQVLLAIATALEAWPGMEHLAEAEINISGHPVHLPERINLPVPKYSEK